MKFDKLIFQRKKGSVLLENSKLLMALHQIGLVALAHTPSPMGFLEKILFRSKNERAFLLIPTGFPAKNIKVPKLKKSFSWVSG